MDIYEQESDLFFEDLSSEVVTDDVFQRLVTFPNVIVTGHQAFFTRETLAAIAQIPLQNLADLEEAPRTPRDWSRRRCDRTCESGPTMRVCRPPIRIASK